MTIENIKELITQEYDLNLKTYSSNDVLEVCKEFLAGLNNGTIRSAENINGIWKVNIWVKQGILLLFRYGKNKGLPINNNENERPYFFDKDTVLDMKKIENSDCIRIPPGGSSIRNGAFVGKYCVCMPPMYINIGAYIDEYTMIDSHALVGTCAQIGKRVHLSAASQIGGVLEPIGANPVIIEDDVMIGGNCGIYEGIIVKKEAVLGSGVILNASTKVYDIVNETIITSSENCPLIIPERAVVVQGARGINTEYGMENRLSISTPLIIKYRDDRTDSKTELENTLRK